MGNKSIGLHREIITAYLRQNFHQPCLLRKKSLFFLLTFAFNLIRRKYMGRLFFGYFVYWWVVWLILTKNIKDNPLIINIIIGISNILPLSIIFIRETIISIIRGP